MDETLIAKRHLDLEGSHNIRDIGGYATTDGRRTRWQTFLRSGNMHELAGDSQAALIDYGVRTVIDLRGSDEVESFPNVFATSTQVGYRHQNMIGDAILAEMRDSPATETGSRRTFSTYRMILDRRRAQVCETLKTLAGPGGLPGMVHCAAGKDRTGIATALVLSIAGVPNDVIAEDYSLSARFLIKRHLQEVAPPEVAASGYTWQDYQREFCPPEAMLSTLQHLQERYGGVEPYLVGGGLSREHIDSIRSAVVE